MAKEILAGSTDQTIDVFAQDSSATDGSGLTGLAYDTASLTCYYRIGATGSWTALTLATQTIGGAHSDGGFVEGSSANAPGMYRLDLSDAMVVTAGLLKIMLKGASDMAPCVVEVEVVAVNKYDAVRMGLTALPNAAADAAGGLPISDAGELDLDTKLANTNEVTAARMGALTDWIDGGRLDLIIDAILADTSELQSDNIPGTLSAMDGKLDTIDGIVDSILVDTGTTIPADLATIAGYLDTEIAAILADTNAILLDTNELQSDDVPGLISALNNISTADVNAQVLDVMNVDTHAEPGQGAPGATISIFGKINYLYKAWRNKKVQDATTYELYDDAGTTVDQKAADSDDGTDATVGEIISGP